MADEVKQGQAGGGSSGTGGGGSGGSGDTTDTANGEGSNSNVIKEPVKIENGDVRLDDSLIPNPIMYAERILNSPAVNGRLTFPIQKHTLERTDCIIVTVPIYMSNDFSLGTFSNKWENLWNTDFLNTFTDFTNALATMKEETQISMQSENMSAKVWKGSDYNGFSIDVLFVATRRTINPARIIRELVATVLPSRLQDEDQTTGKTLNTAKDVFKSVVTGSGNFFHFINDNLFRSNETISQGITDSVDYINNNISSVGLTAPLYYGLKMKDKLMVPLDNTTLTLDVGEYLTIDQLIVNSVSNITFSKEIIAPPAQDRKSPNSLYDNSPKGDDRNYPLWAKCTLNLIPYGMVTKEKFDKWFHFYDSKYNPLEAAKARLNVLPTGTAQTSGPSFDLP